MDRTWHRRHDAVARRRGTDADPTPSGSISSYAIDEAGQITTRDTVTFDGKSRAVLLVQPVSE